MRILMVTDFYHPFLGGVEKHVRSLSTGLVERGHHVAVVTLGRAGLPDFEIDHDVNVYRIHGTAQRLGRLFSSADRPWAPPLPDPELTRALQRIVKQEQPDIVHGHDWLARSFLPLQLRERAPFVVSLHYHTLTCAKKSLMYREAPCSGPQFQKCVRCTAAHYGTPKGLLTLTGNWASSALERKEIDMFLPVSYATAAGNGLVGSEVPYQVIPNFVPTHADSPGDDLASYVEQLPSEGYLLFVGDLRRDKGLHVLLKAYAEMSERIPLVLIGKVWPETPATFPSNVIVFKHWPNYAVMEAWRRSTIALVPSVWPEPCATVVLEAMASGRPVIATRIGGNPEMVVDGETGVLIPPEDPAALRDAIERLLTDQALMKEMGEAGKRRVVAFQSDSVITRIEEVYASVVASKSRTTAVPWPESASVANPPTLSESAARHMPSPSIVSIIINNFNYDRFLKDAIESALNQSYEHTEVIVVDDGSTDTSREIIASYADRVIPVLKENGGQASAFNAGFAHSHGDIVIFLDSDDRLLPHIAAEVVRVFESEPRSAKVQYRLDMIDAAGNPIGRQIPAAELPLPEGDLRQQILRFPDDVRTPPTSGNAFAASTLREILPVPDELQGSTGADLYLYNLSPLYGPVKSLNEAGGQYRIHGANDYYTSDVSVKQMRQIITRSTANHEYIVKHAKKLHMASVPPRGSDILSVTYLVNRIASFKLDAIHHPISGDCTLKLAWLGIVASARRVDVPVRVRLLYMLWFVTAAGSPKSLIRWLVMNVFQLEHRGFLNRFV